MESDCTVDAKATSPAGVTALMLSVRAGNYAAAAALLRCGASPTATTAMGP